MDVCLRDESNSTIGRVQRRDDIPCVSVHLHHEAVGRGEVRHRLEVAHPVVKLQEITCLSSEKSTCCQLLPSW